MKPREVSRIMAMVEVEGKAVDTVSPGLKRLVGEKKGKLVVPVFIRAGTRRDAEKITHEDIDQAVQEMMHTKPTGYHGLYALKVADERSRIMAELIEEATIPHAAKQD
jgi:hypothetical protein